MRSAYIYFDHHAPQEMYVGQDIKEGWKRNEPYCYKDFAQQDYIHIYDNTLPAVEVRRRNSSAVQINGYPLQKLIELQQQQIEKLEKKVKATQDILYCFIGGLYCQRTQGEEIGKLIDNLCDRPTIDVTDSDTENDDEDSEQPKPEKQTSKWSFWPTTRQGDECEREIEALKEEIKMLKSRITPQKKPKTISQLRKFLQEGH
jgi:predicted RNase H-like nuclease (RuvC/YqgF family)